MNSYAQMIQARLAKSESSMAGRDKAYWNLRNAGFTNIEAEDFLAARRHWFN